MTGRVCCIKARYIAFADLDLLGYVQFACFFAFFEHTFLFLCIYIYTFYADRFMFTFTRQKNSEIYELRFHATTIFRLIMMLHFAP